VKACVCVWARTGLIAVPKKEGKKGRKEAGFFCASLKTDFQSHCGETAASDGPLERKFMAGWAQLVAGWT
jgi:hypothetical protein